MTHFEISADNPGRAMDFYSKVFGWTFKRWGEQEYWLARTDDKNDVGINGAILPRTDPSAMVVNTIGVHSLDENI